MTRTSGPWLATVTAAGMISTGLFGVATATTAEAASPVAAPVTVVDRTALSPASGAELTAGSYFSGILAADRPAKVKVPARYVYRPKLGARHDYCTYAPDEFPAPRARNADFRGPCARHDLCYDGDASKKSCDKALRRNLYQNCEHYYGRYNPLRPACKAAALAYWAAVVAS
jgi:hypothetical protein